MNLRHFTMFLLIAGIYLTAIYDTYCQSRGEENTITDVVRDSAKLNAILPVVGGVLAGHLFVHRQRHDGLLSDGNYDVMMQRVQQEFAEFEVMTLDRRVDAAPDGSVVRK